MLYLVLYAHSSLPHPPNHLKVNCRCGDILPVSTSAASPKNKDLLPVTTTLLLYPININFLIESKLLHTKLLYIIF